MTRLIRIELKKIFAKKTIYIFLAIVFGLTLIGAIFEKQSEKIVQAIESGVNASMYEDSMESYDLKNPEELKYYVEDKTNYDILLLAKDYKPSTPEYKYLQENVSETIYCMNENEFINKNQEAYDECKKTYDEQIEFLKHYDWKEHINKEIEDIEAEITAAELSGVDKEAVDSLKLELDILKYRLKNDIPLDYSGASIALDNYFASYVAYSEYDNSKNLISHKDKKEKQEVEKQYFIYKYRFEHDLIQKTNRSLSEDTLATEVLGKFSSNMFAILFLVVISGTIIAEEFNKGTIKQLLLKPYTRVKIMTSKIIATLITFVFFLVVYSLITALIYGILFGDFKSIFTPILVYNFKTSSVYEQSLIIACLESLLAILPMYLILMGISMLLGVITTNGTLATVGPIAFSMAADILNFFATKKFFAFLPTVCWDLSEFLHGGLPSFEYSKLPISIGVDVFTILLLFGFSYYIFRKKDVKNQ